MDEKTEAIRKVAFAFGQTCDEIRKTIDSVIDKENQKRLFNVAQRQIRLIYKSYSKSYMSPYAKFDTLRKKRK